MRESAGIKFMPVVGFGKSHHHEDLKANLTYVDIVITIIECDIFNIGMNLGVSGRSRQKVSNI